MSEKKQKYFNFPICLLKDFFNDYEKCLNDIHDYATYVKCIDYVGKSGFEWITDIDELDDDDIKELVDLADKFFKKKTGDNIKVQTFRKGEDIYIKVRKNMPKVGLSLKIFWDYYENHKSDFEKTSFLAYLAFKSIIQNKAYCKTTNNFLLGRMNGDAKALKRDSLLSLDTNILKYYGKKGRYHREKLITELELNWGLKYYSRYTRGFYVSFKLSLEDLIYQAEKKRKSTLKKEKDFEKKSALQRVLNQIENEQN